MSLKTKFNTYSKSFKEKKNYITKNSIIKNFSLKDDYDLFPQNKLFDIYSIIHKNIKKHSTSTREYHILIINSIIFDQRIHKVAVFKNNLLWDESSEFLKRYYKKKESTERIPKIAEYYEKYTLFPPVYFGLEGLIVIIMNKWTKRKKNYLEYIEDQEEEKEKKKKIKKDISFEPLIHSSLINNKTSSKSILSRNTLDLSKVDNESNKAKVYNTNKNNQLKKNFNKNLLKKNKDKKKENLNSLSFSEIIDDLSSQYSIIINNAENDANFKLKDKEIEIDKKYKKDQNNIIKRSLKKEGRNEININKARNTFNYNAKSFNNINKINNMTKSSNVKSIDSPKKSIKICLNKKNNKYILINNNANIIKRNINSLPYPSEIKRYQKRILNTDNNLYKTHEIQNSGNMSTKNSNKGTIRVNTISNYMSEKNKINNNNNNNLVQKINKNIKGERGSSKKLTNNNINTNINNICNNSNKNSIKKNIIYNNKKKYSNNNIQGNIYNILDKNIINKNNNALKKKFIQIKRKSFAETNYLNNNSISNQKQLTYRSNMNPQICYLNERPTNQCLDGRVSKNNDNNKDSMGNKDMNIAQKPNKKLYLEDPFIYKLTQLTKKKQFSLTSTNSLSKIKGAKNFSYYGLNSFMDNNNFNTNKYNNKINYRKNLVLNKLSKGNMANDNKNKLLGEDIIRNKSTSLHKSCDNSKKLNLPGNISNSHSFKPDKNNNSKNINFNLNLNIHFNIDVENKNKGKKILLNNAIISQLQNKMNRNQKYTNLVQNKENNHQFSLTSRNSKKYLNDLNKIEYTIFKKFN